ncbi:MAG: hypothetical protein E6H41_10120 [Betaproteobacteria bacterium]|nr:MAG: hypothetical protein E6H41_10120 [Betaproteobacteria bacterium]
MDALAIVKRWWRNTKDLPFPLDMLCQGAMVAGPVLLVFLVLPIVEWTVNGRQMSYAELWKSGAGLAFGLFLFLLMIGAWGLAARNLASRWALVAAPAAPYVASVPFLSSGLISTEDVWFGILGGSLVAAIAYACLFHLPAVRRYFAAGWDAHDRQSSRERA